MSNPRRIDAEETSAKTFVSSQRDRGVEVGLQRCRVRVQRQRAHLFARLEEEVQSIT